jgi:photosystem II stability/assembly factor-like uncharacterized protein
MSSTPASNPEALRVGLVGLAAQGAYPGGEAALAAMLARNNDLMAARSSEALTAMRAAAAGANGEIDCGGGAYVRAARLRLYDVRIFESTASTVGSGAGGGLCAVNLPTGGLELEAMVMGGNVASTAGDGFGGALFVGAETPVAGALSLQEVSFRENQAATTGNGYGGGAFIQNAPGARLHVAVFTSNTATTDGRIGLGGGLYLDESAGVTLETVGFQLNNANTALTVPDPTVDWNMGLGGGVYIHTSPNLALLGIPGDEEAFSLLIGNVAALKGLGRGGGAYVENSPNLRVEGVAFLGNYAAFYPAGQGETIAGGAVHLMSSPGAHLVNNDFNQNMAGVFSLEDFKLLGGAVAVEVSNHVLVHGSRFLENATGASAAPGLGIGGALAIGYSDAITVSENIFTGNVADLGPRGGLGGAVHAEASNDLLVHHNTFERNRAGSSLGIGGALVVEAGAGQASGFITPQGIEDKLNERVTISANTFRDNRAALDLSGDQALLGGALAINRTNGLLLFNNLFANNQARAGAAMALLGWDVVKVPPVVVRAAQIVNNTLAANAGESGLHMEMWQTPITLTNNIVVSHTVGIYVNTNVALGGMTAQVDYTVYNANGTDSAAADESTLLETNAITAPVAFVNFWDGDYRLQITSSARDAGDPAGAPPAPPVDIEGASRPFGAGVDIGAYEWHGSQIFLPLISRQTCPDYSGWAAGNTHGGYGMIIHTTDGGCTWKRQGSAAILGAGNLSGVTAVDAQTAWAVGENGIILHTIDGGMHWERQQLPAEVPPTAQVGNSIKAVDRNVLWTAACDKGVSYILRTDNGGQQWRLQTTIDLSPGCISRIDAFDAQHAWAVGGRSAGVAGATPTDDEGAIFHTSDGGRTWSLQRQTPHQLIDVRPVSPDIVWVSGKSDAAFRTQDGGVTWQQINTGTGMTDLNRVFTVDGNDVWMTGDHSVLLHTTNGLAPADQVRWMESAPPVSGLYLMTITFVNAQIGWVINAYVEGPEQVGYVFRTDDGGGAWYAQAVPPNSGFWNLVMVKNAQ